MEKCLFKIQCSSIFRKISQLFIGIWESVRLNKHDLAWFRIIADRCTNNMLCFSKRTNLLIYQYDRPRPPKTLVEVDSKQHVLDRLLTTLLGMYFLGTYCSKYIKFAFCSFFKTILANIFCRSLYLPSFGFYRFVHLTLRTQKHKKRSSLRITFIVSVLLDPEISFSVFERQKTNSKSL